MLVDKIIHRVEQTLEDVNSLQKQGDQHEIEGE